MEKREKLEKYFSTDIVKKFQRLRDDLNAARTEVETLEKEVNNLMIALGDLGNILPYVNE